MEDEPSGIDPKELARATDIIKGETVAVLTDMPVRLILQEGAEAIMRTRIDEASHRTDEVRYRMDEEAKRQADFERRRAEEWFVEFGVDECSACGAGHHFGCKPQSDGRYYCEYCGAEALPEHAKELESEE